MITSQAEFVDLAEKITFAAIPYFKELGWPSDEIGLVISLGAFPDNVIVTVAEAFQWLQKPIPSDMLADIEEIKSHLDRGCLLRLENALAAIPKVDYAEV